MSSAILTGASAAARRPGTPDFDDNGVEELADYLVPESAYGTSTVPEPMTLSLLGLAGLAMLRRRK